ncbi:MAG: right-handed parallel beta-helix repeat-containing protein [Pyrinomonadaceae bacterium]|nr:right-handed parallel beta-helix repeat-containing protein [Sphingobacteriaceae bacterium]
MKKRSVLKTRIFTSILLGCSVLLLTQCKKDNNEIAPQSESSQLGGVPKEFKLEALAATGAISTSYYLEKSLPAGYVKDGSRDYTSYIQAAVTKNANIVFPGFPIMVSDAGIIVGSNKTITFLPGSEIRLKPTSKGTYTILNLSGVSNVTLYNPVVIGDRDKHSGTSGEYGVGLGIRGSSNVTVYSPKISNCWGDGIYIGKSNGRPVCNNIVIKDAYLRKNRRDGISIISVDGLVLDNLYAGYSDGTTPMSGINFEPNGTSDEIKNVVINNPRTEKNGSNGIQIGLRNMLGTVNKSSDITVVSHVDIGSPRFAFKLMCNSVSGTSAKMTGLVKVVNPTWHKTGTNQPLYLSTNQPLLKTTVSSAEVMNTSGSILSTSATYTLLMKQARSGSLAITN